MQTPHITASFRLVKAELDLLLRHAERQLAEYTNYLENREAFDQARLSLRQVAGVIEVIGLPGALDLARALSQSVDALEAADAARTAELLPGLVRGLHLLGRYLDHALGDSGSLRPELLLPAINHLRQRLGQAEIAESRYFETTPVLPKADRGFVLDPDIDRLPWLARRLRHMYQLGLLAVLREENLSQGFFLLKRALSQLEGLCADLPFADFFHLSRGGVEALEAGRLQLSRERRLILGQVDRQLKRLLVQPLELSALQPPETLVHTLLYWIARAEAGTPLLKELKSLAKLDSEPSENLLALERSVLEDAGEGVLPAARKELKAEIAKLVAELGMLIDHPELVREAPTRLEGQLKALALTLDMLVLGEDGQRLRQAAERIQREAATVGREQLTALASELMDVETRLAPLTGLPAEPVETSLSPQANASLEARKLLAQVQESLTAYIANDWDSSLLGEVPGKLDTVCQSLQFLRAERAAVVLRTCADYIRNHLAATPNPASEAQALEILADAIICIDYYLDGLAGNQGLRQGVIELAEESAEALMRLTRAA